jgi:hypothetical protein
MHPTGRPICGTPVLLTRATFRSHSSQMVGFRRRHAQCGRDRSRAGSLPSATITSCTRARTARLATWAYNAATDSVGGSVSVVVARAATTSSLSRSSWRIDPTSSYPRPLRDGPVMHAVQTPRCQHPSRALCCFAGDVSVVRWKSRQRPANARSAAVTRIPQLLE